MPVWIESFSIVRVGRLPVGGEPLVAAEHVTAMRRTSRRDLEQVVGSSDPEVADAKPIAVELLRQIARKQQAGDAGGQASCQRYESCVRDTQGVANDGR